jgi:hypothetical protein
MTHEKFPALTKGLGHFGSINTGGAPGVDDGTLPITHLLRKKPNDIPTERSKKDMPWAYSAGRARYDRRLITTSARAI